MRSIQGQWRLDCVAVAGSGRSQQTRLSVSYTHFTFAVHEYTGAHCTGPGTRLSVGYRFILSNELVLADGTKVFAIDFLPDKANRGIFTLPLQNILSYSNGRLYLGKAESDAAQDRPNQLDYAAAYHRGH